MLFFRRHHNRPHGAEARDRQRLEPQEELLRVDYDMMLKGSVVMRRGKPYRQFGVTVNGSTRLVTSGDVVDRQTYNALLAAGALRHEGPPRDPDQDRSARHSRTLTDEIDEG